MTRGSMRFARCSVDLDRGVLPPSDGGPEVRLTTRERALLARLAERAPEAVSRDELLRQVWGYSDSVLSRACDSTVRRLRLKIEDDPGDPRHLLTAHGSGYQLVPLDGGAAPVVVAPPRSAELVLGAVRIDVDAMRYERGADEGRLTANEARILRALAHAAGKVVDRRELSRQVWGTAGDGRRLVSAIARLRSKVDPEAAFLRTAVGDGYQLVVRAAGPAPEHRVLPLLDEVVALVSEPPAIGMLRAIAQYTLGELVEGLASVQRAMRAARRDGQHLGGVECVVSGLQLEAELFDAPDFVDFAVAWMGRELAGPQRTRRADPPRPDRGRVDRRVTPPAPPTDPDVQVSRIRLLK